MLEKALSEVFFQSAASADVIEEVTASANFDHEEDVLFCLEVLIQADYVLVPGLFEHDYFLHYFLGLGFIRKELFIYAFDSAEALSELVHSKIDLSKRSFAQNLAYSVKVNSGVRSMSSLPKAELYQFYQFPYLSSSRSQVARPIRLFCDEPLAHLRDYKSRSG